MYKVIIEDPVLKGYFPDPMEGSKLPEKNYFFTMVNTICPDYLPQLITHAKKLRV